MLKVLIIDDEIHVREALKHLLELYASQTVLTGMVADIKTAIASINEQKPDVILLDVDLPGESGFDLFKHFNTPAFRVIFVTAYHDYALRAFRFAALDYILKPVDPTQLLEALHRAEKLIDNEKIHLKLDSLIHNLDKKQPHKKIILKTAEQVHVVQVKDIMYCEADRSYTSFYLADKSRVVVSHSMVDYDEMLSPCGFMRVHQSFLVNLAMVKRFEKSDGGKLILKGGEVIPVATRKREALILALGKH